MFIVPVKIQRWKNIKKEVLTYAMLDSCIEGSFLQEDLVRKLQLSGRKTTLNLEALNGERTKSTMLIEGIDAKGVSGNKSWIKLPKIYIRPELPADDDCCCCCCFFYSQKELGFAESYLQFFLGKSYK